MDSAKSIWRQSKLQTGPIEMGRIRADTVHRMSFGRRPVLSHMA